MPYTYVLFDEVALPQAMPEDDLSTGRSDTTLRDSIGGVFDAWQTRTRLPRRHQFSHKGKYEAAIYTRVTSDGDTRVTDSGDVRVTADSLVRDLQGQVDDLKAKSGVLGSLWRERMADGVLTWKACRLMQVLHMETVEEASVVSEVESVYETSMVGWRDETATTSTVSVVAGVATPIPVENAGLLTIEDAILRVARTSGTITAVQATGPGIDITWTGSIGASQTLEIDSGDQTVLRGTSDQYSGLVLNANHTVEPWLSFAPGLTALTVTVTGGNANVTVEHYNQWP